MRILKKMLNLLTSKPARKLYRQIAVTAIIVLAEDFIPAEVLEKLTEFI
jgi:hypothetical protein